MRRHPPAVPSPATRSGPAVSALRQHLHVAAAFGLQTATYVWSITEHGHAGPSDPRGIPQSLTSGATASSEGSQLVCRLPLAAFIPKTIDVESKRPAAVIRYVEDAYAGLCLRHEPFNGTSEHRFSLCVLHHFLCRALASRALAFQALFYQGTIRA